MGRIQKGSSAIDLVTSHDHKQIGAQTSKLLRPAKFSWPDCRQCTLSLYYILRTVPWPVKCLADRKTRILTCMLKSASSTRQSREQHGVYSGKYLMERFFVTSRQLLVPQLICPNKTRKVIAKLIRRSHSALWLTQLRMAITISFRNEFLKAKHLYIDI